MSWVRVPPDPHAPVAQWIRAPVFGTGCRGFESLRAHHMLAIIFLIVSLVFGYSLMSVFFKDRIRRFLNNSPSINKLLPQWLVTVPAGFLLGLLFAGWISYFLSFTFHYFNIHNFQLVANQLTVVILIFFSFWFNRGLKFKLLPKLPVHKNTFQFILLGIVLFCFHYFLMHYTFQQNSDGLQVSSMVYSDFGPHLSLIRSFSMGENFPTQYPHYPNGSINYHFMYQYLIGTLEFLSLPIALSFNFISALSFTSASILLFALTVRFTNLLLAGYFINILWFFRSSFTFFSHIFKGPILQNLANLLHQTGFIKSTMEDEWGFWNLEVYVNQRHLAFALGILFFTLIVIWPDIYKKYSKSKKFGSSVQAYLKSFFFPLPNLKFAGVLGIVLGLLSFWNGAVVIGALLIIFPLMFFSSHKTNLVVIIVTCLFISILLKSLFIHNASAMSPLIRLGFLIYPVNLVNFIKYYFVLLGIAPIIYVFGLLLLPRSFVAWFIAFLFPFIFANTISLTPDIAVNHKYILISVVLLNIIVAYFLARLLIKSLRHKILIPFFLILAFYLTCTGIVDFISFNNLNKNRYSLKPDEVLEDWIRGTPLKSVFLTDHDVINAFLLNGRFIYTGWPYYAWSAGYNTSLRDTLHHNIYNAINKQELVDLLGETNINYITFSLEVATDEAVISSTFPLVFEDKGNDPVRIYQVSP